MWLFSIYLSLKDFWHTSHWNGFLFSWTELICLLKDPMFPNVCWHTSHWNGLFFSWTEMSFSVTKFFQVCRTKFTLVTTTDHWRRNGNSVGFEPPSLQVRQKYCYCASHRFGHVRAKLSTYLKYFAWPPPVQIHGRHCRINSLGRIHKRSYANLIKLS